ncbi:S-layer homology domain-containing protein [Paenibacillus sp. NPDC058071]|uniref:S-layer homology domain-containing protein n=1 Tax=Paenibacillus sp. NPDC058071 TaxID=3346326 RepID=UPI0036DF5F93
MKRNKSGQRLAAFTAAIMLTGAVPAVASAQTPPTAETSVDSGGLATNKEEASAPGDVAVSKEKAASLARKLAAIPDDYTLQSASYSADTLAGGKRGAWSLDFVKKVNGKHKGSIYVRVNSDSGQLLEFSTYLDNPNVKPSYPLKVERDAALKIAASYIAEAAPAYKDQVQYNPSYGVRLLPPLTGEVRHSIRYDRIVNGIPYVDNYVELEIDSEGHVMRYSFVWDDTIQFPKLETRLTDQQAMARLKELAKPELTYLIPYGGKGKKTPRLGYRLSPVAINAADGKLLEETSSGEATASAPLADKPLGEAPKSGNYGEKEAIAAVTSAFKLPAGATLQGTSYNEYNDDNTGSSTAYWNVNWVVKENGNDTGNVYASVNSKTGVISGYNSYVYRNNGSDKPTVKLDEAKAKAIETVKKQLPWIADELYLIEPNAKNYDFDKGNFDTYYFRFVHKIHQAIVPYDGISVAIDARTGDVNSYEGSLADFTYPTEAPKLITEQQAVEKWMGYYHLQLTYNLSSQYVWNGEPLSPEKYKVLLAAGEIKPGEAGYGTEAKLVYRLVPRPVDEEVFVDAQSGEWRSRETGEVTQLERPQAADIKGHWAQRQLELMVAYKALDVKDGKVRPEQIVTRGELIKMLVLTINSGRPPVLFGAETASKAAFNDVAADSAYYAYVETALQQNLIDVGDGTFNPEGKVDREDMAELIVRALGYNTLANHEELFNITFKDAAKTEKKGQAAIAVGLNIMSLSGGNFQPDKQVTRAEASAAFFRFLQTRADLQEAPLRN